MKQPTIDHMDIRVTFDENIERLRAAVLIYTQTFNRMLGLGEGQWGCWVVEETSFTDGASWNPFVTFLLWMEKRDRKIRLAALGHDDLYRKAGLTIPFYEYDKEERKMGRYIGSFQVTRDQADDFIKNKAQYLGSNSYRKNMIREGLRLGGWVAFNRYLKFNRR